MKFRIPAKFQLGGHWISVKVVSEEELLRVTKGMAVYGLFVPDSLCIYLQKPDRKLKASVVQQTFWHEFSHAMLWVMGHKDWHNEKVIDPMGHLLHQFHQTRTFE